MACAVVMVRVPSFGNIRSAIIEDNVPQQKHVLGQRVHDDGRVR